MIDSNDHDKLYITNCQTYFRKTASYIVQIFCHVVSTYPILSYCLFHREKNRYIQKKRAVPCNLSCQPSCREILGVPMHSYVECDSRVQTRESQKEWKEEKREIEGAMH